MIFKTINAKEENVGKNKRAGLLYANVEKLRFYCTITGNLIFSLLFPMFKKFAIYCLRWQLSSPVLAPILIYCDGKFSANAIVNLSIATVIANAVGACIFFWVDKFIFRTKLKNPLWEIKDDFQCFDCGKLHCRCYRLVKAKNYDRLDDKQPEFRCEACSEQRADQLRDSGVTLP